MRPRRDGNGETGGEPVRLGRPREQVESLISRFIQQAEELLERAATVHSAAAYDDWTHNLERWHALARDGLASAYTSAEPADEFLAAATGSIFRQFGQTEDETFQYQQEATRRGINTLRSLRERLEFVAGDFEPGTTSSMQSRTEDGGDVRKVFVVHGRNVAARDALFEFLRAIGLTPLEWEPLVSATGQASPYIGEVLDAAFAEARAAVVLLTPDDESRLRGAFVSDSDPAYERELTGQARPNVLFEAGLAFGRFPTRTVLVELGDLRPISDLGGRHAVRMDDTPEQRHALAERLRTAGCAVDTTGSDWYHAGDFAAAIARADSASTAEGDTSAQDNRLRVAEQIEKGNDILTRLHAQEPERAKELEGEIAAWRDESASVLQEIAPEYVPHFQSDAGLGPFFMSQHAERDRLSNFLNARLTRLSDVLGRI